MHVWSALARDDGVGVDVTIAVGVGVDADAHVHVGDHVDLMYDVFDWKQTMVKRSLCCWAVTVFGSMQQRLRADVE